MAGVLRWLLALALLPLAAAPAVADERHVAASEGMLVYSRPPGKGGAPENRVSGATGLYREPRGSARAVARSAGAGDGPELTTLAPGDHVGMSKRANPTFYWSLSRETRARLRFTLVDTDDDELRYEGVQDGTWGAGLHEFDLVEHGVELAGGRVYRWSITLESGEPEREFEATVSGLVRYEPQPEDALRAALGSEPGSRAFQTRAPEAPLSAARDFAQQGFFYDALSMLNESIPETSARCREQIDGAASSGDNACARELLLRKLRADLLEEVGLYGTRTTSAE